MGKFVLSEWRRRDGEWLGFGDRGATSRAELDILRAVLRTPWGAVLGVRDPL